MIKKQSYKSCSFSENHNKSKVIGRHFLTITKLCKDNLPAAATCRNYFYLAKKTVLFMTSIHEQARHCKACGNRISGRSDKIFCSYNCRAYTNNMIYRKRKSVYMENKQLKKIYMTLLFIQNRNSPFLIKIVLFVAQICKIISTFGDPKSRV